MLNRIYQSKFTLSYLLYVAGLLLSLDNVYYQAYSYHSDNVIVLNGIYQSKFTLLYLLYVAGYYYHLDNVIMLNRIYQSKLTILYLLYVAGLLLSFG
jgi:2-oxo-4-hydroxy-4-carboxy--5-ureidoimidazoline (OHCU) decarboxylase